MTNWRQILAWKRGRGQPVTRDELVQRWGLNPRIGLGGLLSPEGQFYSADYGESYEMGVETHKELATKVLQNLNIPIVDGNAALAYLIEHGWTRVVWAGSMGNVNMQVKDISRTRDSIIEFVSPLLPTTHVKIESGYNHLDRFHSSGTLVFDGTVEELLSDSNSSILGSLKLSWQSPPPAEWAWFSIDRNIKTDFDDNKEERVLRAWEIVIRRFTQQVLGRDASKIILQVSEGTADWDDQRYGYGSYFIMPHGPYDLIQTLFSTFQARRGGIYSLLGKADGELMPMTKFEIAEIKKAGPNRYGRP